MFNSLVNAYYQVMANLYTFGAGNGIRDMLTNTKDHVKEIGGIGLALVGVVTLIVMGVIIAHKFMSKQGNQFGWGKIVAAVLFGGALMGAGFGLMESLSSGATDTITDITGVKVESTTSPGSSSITD